MLSAASPPDFFNFPMTALHFSFFHQLRRRVSSVPFLSRRLTLASSTLESRKLLDGQTLRLVLPLSATRLPVVFSFRSALGFLSIRSLVVWCFYTCFFFITGISPGMRNWSGRPHINPNDVSRSEYCTFSDPSFHEFCRKVGGGISFLPVGVFV
jgi:hypothetical protein